MPLVLAIEPDARQAATLKRIVKGHVHAELILVDSKDAALASLATRIPDLILVTALLPPRDEIDLTAHLKTLEHAGHLQTLTIPLLAVEPDEEQSGSRVFNAFRRKRRKAPPTDRCEPSVFGDEIATYLQRAAELKIEEQARQQREAAAAEAAASEDAALPQPDANTDGMGEGWAGSLHQEYGFVDPAQAAELEVASSVPHVLDADMDRQPAVAEHGAVTAEAGTAEHVYRPAYASRLFLPIDLARPVEGAASVLADPLPAASPSEVAILKPAPAIEEAVESVAPTSFIVDAEAGAGTLDPGLAADDATAGVAAIVVEAIQAAPPQRETAATAEETILGEATAPGSPDQPPIELQEAAVVEEPAIVEQSISEPLDTQTGERAETVEPEVTPAPAAIAEQERALDEAAAAAEVVEQESPGALDAAAGADVVEQGFSPAFARDVEPEPAAVESQADEQEPVAVDAAPRLEPWERLLREIAAQQEALNVEAERAAEAVRAAEAAAAADAARAAEALRAAERLQEAATADAALRMIVDQPSEPAEETLAADAEFAEDRPAPIALEHGLDEEVDAAASVPASVPDEVPVASGHRERSPKWTTSTAVHTALSRALSPLHAFVSRVTSARKPAPAVPAPPGDDVSLAASTAPDSTTEPTVRAAGVSDADLVVPEITVEAAAREDEAWPRETVETSLPPPEEDWRDLTRLIARNAVTAQEESAAVGMKAGTETASPDLEADLATNVEAGGREDQPQPKGSERTRKARRRRKRARDKRVEDFDAVVARLDSAWVASALAVLREDIERLRQDTLAAVPASAQHEVGSDEQTGAERTQAPDANDGGQEPAAEEAQPVQDEWGFYDPGRCGIQALMAKLDAGDAENAAQGRQKRSAMQKVVSMHEARAERREEASKASADKRPAPLSMWARTDEPVEHNAEAVLPGGPLPHLPGESSGLRLPDDVTAVRYASGCRIRRVRVAPGPKHSRDEKRQVVILSRKALEEAG